MAALQLGARCSLQLDDTITHVVAGSSKTDKALLARKRSIPVVSPDWLFACGKLPCRHIMESIGSSSRSCASASARRFREELEGSFRFAAFLWERISEERFQAVQETDTTTLALDPQADLEAALEAAGGGRGMQCSAVGVQVQPLFTLMQSSATGLHTETAWLLQVESGVLKDT